MQLSGQYANKLGKTFSSQIWFCKNVLIGYDKEEHEEIFEQLVEGLMSVGVNVYSIGLVSYEQFNFSCSFYDNDGAIYISDNFLLVDKKGLMNQKKISKIEKRIENYKWKERSSGEFVPLPIQDDYEIEMDKEIHFSNKSIQINSSEELTFFLPYTKLIQKTKKEVQKSSRLSILVEKDKIQFFKSGKICPEDILPKMFDKFQISKDISHSIGGKILEDIEEGGNSKDQYFFKQRKLPSPLLALIYFLNKDIEKVQDIFEVEVKFKGTLKQLKKTLRKEKVHCKLKKSVLFNKNWFTAVLEENILKIRGTKEEVSLIKKIAKKVK